MRSSLSRVDCSYLILYDKVLLSNHCPNGFFSVGAHAGAAIANELDEIFREFDLIDKIQAIVTDSAANMVKGFSLPGCDELEAPEEDDDAELDQVEVFKVFIMSILIKCFIITTDTTKWDSCHTQIHIYMYLCFK